MIRFGEVVGQCLAVALLTPIYLVGFSLTHFVSRMKGYDPLAIRGEAATATYWQQADRDVRKKRNVIRMFTTENLSIRGGRSGLFTLASGLILAIVATEFALRLIGIGSPVLYINDPAMGYMPLPQQTVRRYGGEVSINQYGMRCDEFTPKKPKDTLRIFMIGDSTLYGGSYVDQKDIYASQLEGILAKQLQSDVEVLAMGVNGWGPFHKCGYVDQKGAFDADIAVVCLPIDDIYRPMHSMKPGGAFHLAHDPPKLAISEILHVAKRRLFLLFNKRIQPTDEARSSQAKLGIEAYCKLAQMLSDEGCEVIFEVLPSRENGIASPETTSTDDLKVKKLREAVAPLATFDYPQGLFFGNEPDEIYSDRVHLSDEGHRQYAEFLAMRLMAISNQIEGPRVNSTATGSN